MVALNTETFQTYLAEEKETDILMFMAGPACFLCNEVWPDFEKTVRVLHRYSSGIAFTYVDMKENELQEIAQAYSFPQIRLYQANTDRTKTWVLNQEDSDYDSMLAFL